MGSTGEADRKRRHVNPISPTAASAKKQHFLSISEDKKLDIAVLQYQNQKLIQKLEAQKIEYLSLENKFSQLEEKHQPYDSTLHVVNKSWEELARDLESCSIHTRETSCKHDVDYMSIVEDESESTFHEAFLSRLTETGATESSSSCDLPKQMEAVQQRASEQTKKILSNIVAAVDNLWYLKDGIHTVVLKKLSEYGSCRQRTPSELHREVKNLRVTFTDLFLKHKSLSKKLQSHRDIDAKNKAELRILRGELQNRVAELEESNCKLAILKARRDATKVAGFPVLNLGSKHVSSDKVRDKVKDIQDMETALEELMDQASCRLKEIKGLHEERVHILQQLSNLQSKLKNVACISSSQAYLLVRDQIEKSKSEVIDYKASYEKLQAEKDILVLKERELSVKSDVIDFLRRSAAIENSKISDLRIEIQKQNDERKMIETKVEDASREPGRKEIIAEFKALVSSFPMEMENMQDQLRKHKETASDVHSLRADVQSLSNILDRKVKECETLFVRFTGQAAEIQKLQTVVHDLKESTSELKLFLEMFRRESTDSRDVLEARDLEYKAWAYVHSLKSSLDEHKLELRVKTANEAEAISQQKLAAAEAEIADMRQKLEASKRNMLELADVLKSKNEENEAYLSEIETIGQAYDDMQTQNQHLIQQITERDDYNIKLVLEGLRARQLQDELLMGKRTLEREIQQANSSLNFYDMKAARIEDQLKTCSDQIQKLVEDKFQSSAMLDTTQKKLLDVKRSSEQTRGSLDESQSKIYKSRAVLLELQIELEKERFEKRRIEEELEVLRRKASRLQAQTEGSSIIEKLQQELGEYREILKCSICLDRTKQVVITKCYHLFCNPCVQHIIETRQRKCPTCSTSFGPNDVKSVYI
ncbi:E3 ubiquitin-protein ligase BRE1-like 1 isoform X1 [Humulus lupulus]|uniref:E3 ubiquitin-protein ligase BRE1-like 1 isoform X1 n=2 Tax=Humulus lupulus TaxID=3486 RepID=UPI002B40A0A5|nr:E3 ubiquitin-protein ligase BRE1-like 1 isoform X1 [Humulus lupulus]